MAQALHQVAALYAQQGKLHTAENLYKQVRARTVVCSDVTASFVISAVILVRSGTWCLQVCLKCPQIRAGCSKSRVVYVVYSVYICMMFACTLGRRQGVRAVACPRPGSTIFLF